MHKFDSDKLRRGHTFLQGSFILVQVLFNLSFGVLAGITIFFLEQANEDVKFTSDLIQVVVGELAPPNFRFATHLLPLAFEYIFVHWILLGSFEKTYSLTFFGPGACLLLLSVFRAG